MEKVFIKPVSKEILIKNSKEGPTDIFSYDYEADHAKRGLGNLYVVGNIQGGAAEESDGLDVGYVINLVASLAKREYYSNPDLPVKESFSAALKKINGVVEEFFKKKDTKINVGIFAVAGGEIHISKLGKFKILLSREGKNIDILNNVDLFDKEATQEKEFSNIISGKIHAGDRLLAFYPSRTVVAREKLLKDHLLKSSADEFATAIAAIKDSKPDFACAAVHIDMQKGTESAVEARPQPKELISEPEVEPIAKTEIEEEDTEKPAVKVAKKAIKDNDGAEEIKTVAVSEFPHIIPSEFALGRKDLPFAKQFRRLQRMYIHPRNRAVAMGGAAVIVIAAVVSLKMFVFVSPEARQLSEAVQSAESNLKLAQTKISQNDLLGAHSLLVSTLASLASADASGKAENTMAAIAKALDDLDQAKDASLSLAAEIPSERGNATLIGTQGANLYAYADQSGTGALLKVSNGSVDSVASINAMSPTAIFGSETYITLVDPAAKKTASWSLKKSSLGTSTFSETLVDFDFYQDNLYGLTGSTVIKITDAAAGHKTATTWLQNGTALTADSALVAVDGDVFVISKNGIITTYYKGQKKNEANTPIAVDASSLLLTTPDSASLYVVNKTMGRIYVLKKDTGSLVKTLKINANQAITDATIDSAETLYILSDNKIWKVQ